MGKINQPYGTSSYAKELDLREELRRLLYGADDEVAKGRVGLLRIMRRDSNGVLTRCPCRDKVTDEPDRDYFCKYCYAMGYLWDEYKIVYHKNDESFRRVGEVEQDFTSEVFYLEYYNVILPKDVLVEVVLDSEGRPVQPVTRSRFYQIVDPVCFRADDGRIEFWRLRTKLRRDWSVHYGVPHGQYS